jgi:hypothetical protein
MMSIAAPLGALLVGSAVSTTEFETMSMAGPLGGTACGFDSIHHRV